MNDVFIKILFYFEKLTMFNQTNMPLHNTSFKRLTSSQIYQNNSKMQTNKLICINFKLY